MTEAIKLSLLGRAALAYAKMGMRVFTCLPRSKKPMGLCSSVVNTETGEVCDARLPAKDKATGETTCRKCGTIHEKDVKLGLYLATTDEATIIRWWTKEPRANIGIRCGDGLLVFDVDVPNPEENKTADGEASLALLEADNEDLPPTPHQNTGQCKQTNGEMRRGRQYFFSVEGEYKNSASKLGPGLDTRCDGGYVVAAPSLHPSGINYEWEDGFRPSQIPIAPAPEWLLKLLEKPKHLTEVPKSTEGNKPAPQDSENKWVKKALDGEYDRVAGAGPGTRNSALNTAAFKLGQLIGGNVLSERDAKAVLEAGAEKNGWAAEEGAQAVANVIASGIEAGMKAPRSVPERGPYQAPKQTTRPELKVIDNTKPEAVAGEKKKRKRKEDDETDKPVPRTGWMVEDWEDHCEFKPETRILAPKVVRNAIAILMHRAEFADLFMFNKRTQTVVVTRQPPWTANGHPYPRPIQDADVTGFQSAAEKLGLRLNHSGYYAAVNFAARERDFDPVKQRLESLEWDNIPRLDHWLIDIMGCKEVDYVKQAGAKWMIAAAGRVLHPGRKFDYMLVLEGPQGLRKSMALRVLAETLGERTFMDRLSPLKNKDSMIEIIGKVIVEVAELAAFRGVDVEEIKRFLSAQDDELRLPWDRNTTTLLRGCVFAGTLNPNGSGWLEDPTGGRRFWPVTCVKSDIDQLKEKAPQLWAEAKHRFLAGEVTWLDDVEVERQAVQAVASRMTEDVWSERVEKIILGKDRIRTSEILTELGVPVERQDAGHGRRIAKIMTRLEWRRREPKIDGKTTRVWIPPIRGTLLATLEDEESNE